MHLVVVYLIIWCSVVVSTTMSQNERVTWTQHENYSVVTEFVKVSKSLDETENSLKEYMGNNPTPQEQVIHEYLKTAKTSLDMEKEKIDHVIRHNEQLQCYVRVLEQKVREQTALLRAHRTKWYQLRYKDVEDKQMEIHKKAMMMMYGDDVTKRMCANEVKDANDRALEMYNRCKTGFSTVDEVMSQKRKSEVITTIVDTSVSTTRAPQSKTRRLTNEKTENS